MSDNSKILEVVKRALHQVTGKPVDEIGDEHRLVWDLSMDSVEIIDFIMHMESEGIFLNDDQISGDMTVLSVAKAIGM